MPIDAPLLLPEVDAVEVVVLRGVELGRDGYMPAARMATSVRLHGESASRVAGLWRVLPAGAQMRCHIPPFGLRFFVGERMVCEASICWRCNNIWGHADGAQFHYEFDAAQTVSRELLAACEEAAGNAAKVRP